jgi:hypothetical protein
MLRALQADVNAWPQRVKDAGVTNAGGAKYVPVSRNLEILRTPDDPEATYAYMRRVWEAPGAESGSAGMERVMAQVGPTVTWEWLMADPDRPYAELFEDLRERVANALMQHPSYALWQSAVQEKATAEADDTARIQRIMDEMRSGKRSRPNI